MAELRRFRKKPVVIEAVQWFENGDHPDDGGQPEIEGQLVRYFRHPDYNGQAEHFAGAIDGFVGCGRRWHDHGWIDTLEGGHTVCPGDWIITGVQGEHYPCKPDIFEASYEPADG